MGFLDINNEISIYEIIGSTKLELIILKVNFIFVISKDLEDSITRIYIYKTWSRLTGFLKTKTRGSAPRN